MGKRQLPPGFLLWCPTPGCKQLLYGYRSADGRLLVVCTTCKFSAEPPPKAASEDVAKEVARV